MNTPYQSPQSNNAVSSNGSISNKRLKSISPLKAGVVMGVLYAILILFMMLLFTPLFLTGMFSGNQNIGIPASLGAGIGILIVAPIMYGVFGFIGGVVCAWVYNLVAKITGGLTVTVEDVV
jgi:hypothetical protein